MKLYFENKNAKIYLGDAAELLDVVKPKSHGLVILDPPYAASAQKGEWRVTASVAVGINAAAKAVADKGAMLCFSTSSGRGVDFTIGAVGKTLNLNRVLTWHKSFVRSRVAGPWRWDSVLILGFGRCSFGRPMSSTVFTSSGPSSKKSLGVTKHPAELPDGIAEWLTAPFLPFCGSVLDPFCGTGQLLVPAYKAGLNCIGVEIDERWAEVAAKRLQSEEVVGLPAAIDLIDIEEVA